MGHTSWGGPRTATELSTCLGTRDKVSGVGKEDALGGVALVTEPEVEIYAAGSWGESGPQGWHVIGGAWLTRGHWEGTGPCKREVKSGSSGKLPSEVCLVGVLMFIARKT